MANMIIDQSQPDRGSSATCPHCGIQHANQHSLRESAKCDWSRKNGKAKEVEIKLEASSKQ